MSDVHERLRRLLFLVPYVARHPGIRVDELAQALGTTREALLEELDLLTMVGRPPFQPDDCIDIYAENDRVFVSLEQRLSAPPRLTASEAVALSAAAALLKPQPGDPLSSALEKLETIVPRGSRERVREMGQKLDAALDAPPELTLLAQAISRRQEIEFDYFAQNRGTTEHRTVQPFEVLSHRGHWYLSGYCLSRNDERLFRVDRMRGLAVTARPFERRPSTPVRVPDPTRGRAEVRVRFTPVAAPYVRERFASDVTPLSDGGVEVWMSGESERWLTQWVLSFGGEAEVVEPAAARSAVARAAAASVQSASR